MFNCGLDRLCVLLACILSHLKIVYLTDIIIFLSQITKYYVFDFQACKCLTSYIRYICFSYIHTFNNLHIFACRYIYIKLKHQQYIFALLFIFCYFSTIMSLKAVDSVRLVQCFPYLTRQGGHIFSFFNINNLSTIVPSILFYNVLQLVFPFSIYIL